jgi:hypothetical protein
MKRAQQRERNQQGGYYVAAADPAAAEAASTISFSTDSVSAVAGLTDGAYRAVTTFGITNWRGLMAQLKDTGPKPLIAQVRDHEAKDPEATRWQRTKISDDASACFIEVPSEAESGASDASPA